MVHGIQLWWWLPMLVFAYGCGKVSLDNPLESRVVGGHEATDGNWPFIASLCVNDGCVCTASIIGKSYVLTAAHCVDDETKPRPEIIDASAFWVLVGTFSDEVPAVIRAKRIVTGRYWNRSSFPTTWTDDVALVELEKAIEFDDYAQPICLPKSFRERPGDPAYFVGFGVRNVVAEPSNGADYDYGPVVANENIVTFRTWSRCRLAFNFTDWLHPENHICAAQHMRLIHQGDSGGPLIVNRKGRWFQVGIASIAGSYEGMGDGGFERVTSRCKWIEKGTNGTVKCMRT